MSEADQETQHHQVTGGSWVPAEERYGMIAEAAYFIAERGGFERDCEAWRLNARSTGCSAPRRQTRHSSPIDKALALLGSVFRRSQFAVRITQYRQHVIMSVNKGYTTFAMPPNSK